MDKVLRDISFDQWVRFFFDRPVADPPWYQDADADSAEIEPERVITYATNLFESAGNSLAPYSDVQVDQGLWCLISEVYSPLYVLAQASIPSKHRVQCIHSISKVFEQCFVPRCTAHLSHFCEPEPGTGAINSVCYMWWDIFPLVGKPENSARREIDEACLSVMETTLQLPSIACQESALHGLGHWGSSYPDRCHGIISNFIQRHGILRRELLEYAKRAKERNIL
jgi:hypothetical protein